MIPVFDVISFLPTNLSGSTKPLVVTAKSCKGDYRHFVIKIFSQEDSYDSFSYTIREFYSAFNSKHFEIKTPFYALLKISDTVLASTDPVIKSRIEASNRKCFFGVEFIEPTLDYSPSMGFGDLKEYDIENIFGFDVLIRNVDRRIDRPNLFFSDKKIYVIDHDSSLLIGKKTFDEYMDNPKLYPSFITGEGGNREHIFYSYIKRNRNKLTFDEFEENLRTFPIASLKQMSEQLDSFGFNVEDFDYIYHYFEGAKNKPTKFKEFLNLLIGN